ncbi:MAG TPA: hypothetical protein VF606_10885, partial [Geminicoccaceae bacterium]
MDQGSLGVAAVRPPGAAAAPPTPAARTARGTLAASLRFTGILHRLGSGGFGRCRGGAATAPPTTSTGSRLGRRILGRRISHRSGGGRIRRRGGV